MTYFRAGLFLFVIISATSASAQPKMQVAKLKQRLMTEMKISDVKADSAVNIVMDFYKNARAVKSNPDMKDEDRKSALQENRKAEMGRLHAAGFTSEELQKLKKVMDEMKQERQHRKGATDSTSA